MTPLESANRLVEHYTSLFNREQQKHHYYKAQLFDAWKSLQQQQKGMRRMARKIQRQQFVITQQKIELALLRLEIERAGK